MTTVNADVNRPVTSL